MLRRLSLILFWCVFGISLYAQTPAVDIPLTVSDGAGGTATLRFGIDPSATDGLDVTLGEQVLPPAPPTGVFDARFNLPVNNDASLKDYRQGTAGVAVTKYHELAYQVGTGTQITIGWTLPANVTGRLNDIITGTIIDVPMSGTGSYVVTNPSGLPKLKMTINYPAGGTAPAAPVLLAPTNGATNQETALTLSWNASTGADKYNVQVSTSSAFSTFVVNDTNVTTTSKAVSGLANSTTYYWRVNAKNSTGTSSWSTVWSFTTKAGTTGLLYDLPLTITDGTANQTLKFGIAPDATDGIDSQYGEAPLPPVPPTGVFDARFNLPVNNDASLKDYRQGASGVAVTKYYEVAYQVGTGTQITIGWNLPAGVTGRLNDIITGTIIDVPMSGTGSYVVTNPSGLPKLKMTMNYPGGITPPAAPVLVSPVNGATNQETALTLSWNASTGADKYNVQVSTSNAFTTFVVNDTNVTTTSKAVSGLANSTTYYWRVNAKNSAGVSSWSTVYSFTTKAGTVVPAAPVLSSPTNGATNQETSLTLSWNASTGADKYNVQVSTSNAFTTFVVNDTNVTTTSKAVSGLANSTTYYWRVNAKNSAGVSSWSTVFSFTTKAGTPGLVYDLPLTISDGTSNQTLKFGIAADATDGIDSQYGEAPLPPVPPTGVFDARFNLPVNNDASIKDYRQGTSGTALTKYHELAYQVGTGTQITIGWNLPANVSGRLNDIITGTIIDVPMSGTGSYVVTNPSGLPKLKMTIVYPGGGTVPAAPVLSTPANNATNQETSLTLGWNASTGAEKYIVQVSTTSAFTSFVVNDSNVTTTSKAISGLLNNTTYYWRVAAKNSVGTSSWSEVWNFKTKTATTGLVYDLPLTITDGTSNQTLKFGLAPDATDGIDSQYGEAPLPPVPPTGVFDARFNLPVNNDASIKDYRQGASGVAITKYHELAYQVGTGTQITIGWNLPTGVTGRLNDIITGTIIDVPMSGTGSYIVTNPSGLPKLKMTMNYPGGVQPLDPPVLVSPANNATGQATALTLSWNATTNATKYTVQVSTSSAFTTFVVNDTNVTTTTKEVTGLAYSTQYYWRVKARNATTSSEFSSVWNFTTTTAPQPPAAPVLVSPVNHAANQAASLPLTWNPSATATLYHVQVARDAAFTQLAVNDSGVTNITTNVQLAYQTTYYWRVRAKNTVGWGSYSTVWDFSTVMAPPAFDIPLVVTDSAGGTLELRFGLAPSATDGLDTLLGEYPLPPLPPTGVFDARFLLPEGNEASWKDYRKGYDTSVITKVYNLQYQVGSGTKITLKWTLPTRVFGRLQDAATGTVIDVPMLGAGSFVVTNPGTINKLKMTIYYVKETPAPTAPVLVFPEVDREGVAPGAKFVWKKAANALVYRFQVCKNVLFTSNVIDVYTYDSTFTPADTNTLVRGSLYYWKVTAYNTYGNAATYQKFRVALVGIFDNSDKPTSFNLAQNYPNPFNPATRIAYSVPAESKVTMEVFTVLGEKVATLVNGSVPAGTHSVTFDARNLNSGMYLVRIEAKSGSDNFVQVRKMILMK